MKLAWGSHPNITAAHRAQVLAIAQEMGFDPSWLMAAMYFESRLDPKAVNPTSGASGLIQFMPTTARALGTTVGIIRDMPIGEQLALVREYFLPYAGRLKSLASLYMAILYPKAIDAPDDAVIFATGSAAYAQNSALDLDRDGAVTKVEAASFVQKRYDEGMQAGNVFDGEVGPIADAVTKPTEQPAPPQGNAMDPLSIVSILGPIIGKLIPQVGALFGPTGGQPQPDKPQPQLNVIQAILDTLVQVTQGQGKPTTLSTVGAAVDAMQADKTVQKKATEAVVTHPDIIGALQIVEVGGGVAAARAADAVVMQQEKPFWRTSAVFWISVMLVPMVLWYVGASIVGGIAIPDEWPWYAQLPLKLFGTAWDAGAKVGLANLVVGLVLGGICGVYFGVSVTQAKQSAQDKAQAPPSL